MLGLYVHIPFCEKKCYYCDFVSYVGRDELIDIYIDALEFELSNYESFKFDTIFVGGGTPTYLNKKDLEKLLRILSKFHAESVEFTFESNPGTLDKEKLMLMKAYGVNRLSMGLQSANANTLDFIGRIHDFRAFDRNFNDAYNLGFDNINVDLMYAIPCERIEDYKKTLNIIKDYNLSHISAYNLILEEDTKFYDMYKKNKLKELGEDLQNQMYSYTKDFLKSIGFLQYEVSNYCKPGKMCRHNMIYWDFQDYIGVGVSAHSFYNGSRFSNTRDIKLYIDMFRSREIIFESKQINSLNDNIFEFIMLGLRKTKGINIADFNTKFNVEIFKVYDFIDKHIENGLLILEDYFLRLTDKGFVLMNYVLKDFVLN